MDNQIIANNTSRNAFELSLGQHKFVVEKDGEVLAERNFSISTNLADQIKLTGIMYKTGHIKNRGIITAIQAKLVLAQSFKKLGLKNMRNSTIQDIIKFIIQQNNKKKPLIDDYARELLIKDLNFLMVK